MPPYMLVAFYSTQPGSLEAGVKYLVQSATGSIFVMIGVAMVFMVTGETNLVVISKTAAPSTILLAAGALFIIGFWRQSGACPYAYLAAGRALAGTERCFCPCFPALSLKLALWPCCGHWVHWHISRSRGV